MNSDNTLVDVVVQEALLGQTELKRNTAFTKTARNATAIAISSFLARGIQFAWLLILGRFLGAGAYGLYSVIGGMIATAATVAEFGMGLIVLRDVAQRPKEAGRYLSATLIAQLALALVGYIGVLAVSYLFPNEAAIRVLVIVAGLSLFIDVLGNVCYNELLALEQMVTASTILVVHIIILIAFVAVVVLQGGNLMGLYIATVLASCFRAAMYWWAIFRAKVRPTWSFEVPILQKLFKDGWPLAASAFLHLVYQHIDKIITLAMLGDKDAGYLAAAFTIVFGVVELTNTTILIAIFPEMSRLARENVTGLRQISDRLAFLTLALTLPIGIGISELSPKLATLLFPGFIGTADILKVLIWHAVVMMVGNIYAQAMIVENRQRRMLIIRSFGLMVNIGANLVLLPIMKVQGAAIAVLLGELVVLTLLVIEYRVWADNPRLLLSRIIRLCLAGLLMFAAIAVLNDFNLIIAGAVGSVVYLIALIVLRVIPPDDWTLLEKYLRSLPVVGPAFARYQLRRQS